ncbi:hypothetical protein MRX96_002627 [Rhipicephalus microplus]
MDATQDDLSGAGWIAAYGQILAPGHLPVLQRSLAPESESALEGACVTNVVAGDVPVADLRAALRSKAKLTWAD